MTRSRTMLGFLMLIVVAMCAVVSAEVEETGPPTRIFLKKTEPKSVATMRHKGSFDEIPAVVLKLIAQVQAGGYHMTGPLMAIYYSNPQEVPEEELELVEGEEVPEEEVPEEAAPTAEEEEG